MFERSILLRAIREEIVKAASIEIAPPTIPKAGTRKLNNKINTEICKDPININSLERPFVLNIDILNITSEEGSIQTESTIRTLEPNTYAGPSKDSKYSGDTINPEMTGAVKVSANLILPDEISLFVADDEGIII